MISKGAKDQEPISYQALLDENHALLDENSALQDEIQSLRTRLEEAEELKRAISEGDLDALILPAPAGELIFTLDNADRAYRVLVETMNEGTATLGYDGTILYCNIHFAELLRMPLQTIVGTSIFKFIVPENETTFKALLKQEISKGEINLLSGEGMSLPVYLSISSLKAEGSPNAWCLVATDLTEQKKNEELLASERLARSIIEQAAEAIIVCDTSGRVIRFSSAVPKLCKYDPTLQRFEEIIDLRLLEGIDAGESILPVSTALKGSAILGVEVTFEPKSQKFHLLLNSGPLKNAKDKIIGCVVTLTDITERKHLEESEERFKALMNHNPSLVFMKDECGRYVYLNNAYEKQFVHSKDWYGKTDFDFWPKESAESFRANDSYVLESGQMQQFLEDSTDLDGTRYCWLNYKFPFTDSKNKRYVGGIGINVTDRVRTEEALKESERRYHLLFENMLDGFAYCKLLYDDCGRPVDFVYLNTNTEFERLTGLKGVTGKRVTETIPGIEELHPELFDTYGRVASTGQPEKFEIEFKPLGIWLSVSVYSTEKEHFVVVFDNITGRKQAEELLAYQANLLANISEVVYSTDDQLRLVSWNQAAEKVYGWKEEEVLGKNVIEVTGSVFNPEMRARLNIELQEKGSVTAEFEHTTASGERIIFDSNTMLLRDAIGKVVGYVAVSRNITERKQLEEQTRRRAEELETVMEVAPVAIWIGHDPQSHDITGNRMANEFYEAEVGENVSANVTPVRRFFYKGCELTADELPMQQASLKDIDIRNTEFDVLLPSGESRTLLGSASPLHDADERVRGSVGTFIDITERKRMEEALRESEERYRTLFNSMDEGFCIIEVIFDENEKPIDYTFLETNPAFEKQTGLKNAVGKRIRELAPENEEYWYEIYGKVALTGESARFENRAEVLHRWYEVYAYRIGQLESRKVAILFNDITQRKQAEEALHLAYEEIQIKSEELEAQTEELQEAYEILSESEEKYRNIIETANEGIWIVDPEARTTYVNKKMAEMLGYAREEMIGRSGRDFTDEEGKAISKRNMEKRKEGINESHEYKLIRKDGSPLWTLINAKPLFDKNGKFIGSMSMLSDITKRKEAEDKLKETLDNLENLVKERTKQLAIAYNSLKESEKGLAEAQKMAHLGNWSRNLITGDLYWSDEVYRIFGFKPQEFGVNYDVFLSHVHPDDQDRLINAAKQALKGNTSSIDYRIVLADGEERTVHEEVKVVFDEKNNPVRMRGIVQDITERKMAEKALQKMDQIRIKEIHHRIKNNLQVISSLLDLQAEAFSHLEVCKVPEVIEAFMESQNRVISMALIHEELYKGSKIDTLDFGSYLNKLTADLFNSYNFGNKDISFKLNLEQVDLDMDTAIPLGIIVNELVSNSFKYAFPAGREGEIQINLFRTENSASKSDISISDKDCMGKSGFDYILEVSDNGKGIPEEIGLESSNSLGLQLVNILVEQIDGEIELKRDKGTEFKIRFNVQTS